MLIRRMISVFGNQENQVLELSPGLNILQASDEAGKSAWCAFLLAMLYGVSSQDLAQAEGAGSAGGPVWSGAAHSGQLDCQAGEEPLRILRATRRGGPPMGEFRALSSATGAPAPGLTSGSCGEALLGVRREEFVRTAIICPREQAAGESELAQHIAALLPTGGAEASGPNASDTLEKELEFRRSGKTGRLPSLEAELQETTALMATQDALSSRLRSQGAQKEALAAQTAVLEAELTALDRWEAYRQQQACRRAEAEAEDAEAHAASIRDRLERRGVPETDTVARLRGAIVNLNTARKNGEQTRQQRDQAAEALLEAETRLNENPFAEMTREEAEALPINLRSKPQFPRLGLLVLLVLGLIAGLVFYFLKKSIPISLGAGCLAAGAAALILGLHTGRQRAHWAEQAEQKRKRRETDLADWEVLRKAAEQARAENAAKSAAWESLQTTLLATEQGILEEVRRFAPGAVDIPAADAALRAAAILRKDLAAADAAAREARARCVRMPAPQLAAEGASAVPEEPPAAPRRSREAIQRDLQQSQSAEAALSDESARLSARIQAIGSPEALRAKLEALADQIAGLEKEYTALSLALSALDESGNGPQGLYSPDLGRKTAEIFTALTAIPTPQPEAPLSAAADQLYLALRLAICQLTPPEGTPLPIILDDALADFDSAHCEAALRWIRQASKERQILLFTSSGREAAHFQRDTAVAIHHLAAMY